MSRKKTSNLPDSEGERRREIAKRYFPEVDNLSIEEFLLEDIKKQIENQFMIKDGWLKIFYSEGTYSFTNNIIAQFIPEKDVENFLKSHKWIAKWDHNFTTVFDNMSQSRSKTKTDEDLYSDNIVQLINLSSHTRPDQVWMLRVNEELVNSLKLEDQARFTGRPKRDFCVRNKEGNLQDVLNIRRRHGGIMDSSILSSYLAEKKLKLAICFYIRRESSCPDNWIYEPIEEICRTSQYIYKHKVIRPFPYHRLSYIIKSDICGKVIVEPKKSSN